MGVEKSSLDVVQMYPTKPMCFCIVSVLSTLHTGEIIISKLLAVVVYRKEVC